MGLAASQARLLTITARKADCEFLSMNLSHQKLSLARDMENISSEYQNALNQTKLVYDYYGSGDKTMDLTYGLLMEPSIYNDYYPKLVTDSKNRVILNSAYAQAAKAAGIPAEGLLGTPSSEVRNKFIEALVGANVITPTRAASIEAITYGNDIGLGATVSSSVGTTEITYDELINILKSSELNSSNSSITLGSSYDTVVSRLNKFNDWGDNCEYLTSYTNGNRELLAHGSKGGNVQLSDLLNSDTQYVLSMESIWGERTPIVTTAYMQDKLVNGTGSFLTWMLDAFANILGGTAVSDTALQYAANELYDILCPTNNLQEAANNMYNGTHDESASDRKHHTEPNDGSGVPGLTYRQIMEEIGVESPDKLGNGYAQDNEAKAPDYIGFYFNCARNPSGRTHKQTSEAYINLNNLAKVFLTAYVQYMQGIDDSKYEWQLGKISESTLYDPQKDDFKFTMVTGPEVDTGDSQLYANFYDALFNRICINGWVENARIDEQGYMQELLKNGMAFMSNISDDGFYYQCNYSTDNTILEVTDDEAIARAEAKYNTEKAKIESKEDTIDMKMKNLDTEISSLTQEYDTTKQVITKAIEKSFKRYDA